MRDRVAAVGASCRAATLLRVHTSAPCPRVRVFPGGADLHQGACELSRKWLSSPGSDFAGVAVAHAVLTARSPHRASPGPSVMSPQAGGLGPGCGSGRS